MISILQKYQHFLRGPLEATMVFRHDPAKHDSIKSPAILKRRPVSGNMVETTDYKLTS
jgi:hypothetical protein